MSGGRGIWISTGIQYAERHGISLFEHDPSAPNLWWGFFVEGFHDYAFTAG